MSQDRFSDQKYVDWLKVKLSLQFAKEGLEPITEQKVQSFHNRLCHKLQAPSSSSAAGGPTNCNTCVKDDQKQQWSKRNFSCRNGICNGWLDLLQKEHVHMTAQFTPRVGWDNVDVSQLPTNRWECVKLFLPRGSRNVQRAGDADLASILTLFQNCRHFACSMNDVTMCKRVKEVRNRLMHSGTMNLDAAHMQTDICCIKQLLSDPAFAADRACQEAISKIDQLVQDKLELSLNKELELKALNSGIKYVVDSTDQLKTDVDDVITEVSDLRGQVGTATTEVTNLRDQQRTDIGAVTTEVSGLKDQLKTDIGDVTTEVSNLRDQVGTATTDMSNLRDQVVEFQKVAGLLCSFINACQIDKVDMGQLAISISTLSALRAETDRQGQIVVQLQEAGSCHEVTLEQHGGKLEQNKRKLCSLESEFKDTKKRRSMAYRCVPKQADHLDNEDEAVKKVHLELNKNLFNAIDIESSEYRTLCLYIENILGRGLARSKKTFLEKLDALETNGKLRPGNYCHLREIFRESGNGGFESYIDDAEAKIEEIRGRRRNGKEENAPMQQYNNT